MITLTTGPAYIDKNVDTKIYKYFEKFMATVGPWFLIELTAPNVNSPLRFNHLRFQIKQFLDHSSRGQNNLLRSSASK